MIRVKWDQLYGSSGNDDNGGSVVDGGAYVARSPAPHASTGLRPPRRRLPHHTLLHSHHQTANANKLSSPVPMFGSHGVIPEMDTICEVSAPSVYAADWSYNDFHLNDLGQVTNRSTNTKINKDEMRDHGEGILRGLIAHVHDKMLREFQFVEQAIPALDDASASSTVSIESSYTSSSASTSAAAAHSMRSSSSSICSTADGFRTMVDSDVPRCIFHTSENYRVAEKLLVFVCSSRGLSCGIWSRSLLLQEGVHVGSMIPYFRKAREAGYGILVMNPNMNTQTMLGADGAERKLPIQGSSTQEEHCDHVWQHFIFPSAAHKIHFIAYGYGGILVTSLLEKYRYELKNRLGNVAFIESSHKVDHASWSDAFRRFFSQHSICWKRSSEPLNAEIGQDAAVSNAVDVMRQPLAENDDACSPVNSGGSRQHYAIDTTVFGCLCLSAGPDTSVSTSPAYTTTDTLDTVFKFLSTPSAYEFHRFILREVRMRALHGEAPINALGAGMNGLGLVNNHGRQSHRHHGNSRMFTKVKESMTVDDFQLLRVVGRGAFGKVMLVKKKKKPATTRAKVAASMSGFSGHSRGEYHSASTLGGSMRPTTTPPTTSSDTRGGGRVYAMKVIKKAAVFAKNQVEHTKTERRILEGVDHPFAVKLRYAFQTDTKLFFVMDYYNGGTLHFHLRQARRFDESRARFYAAQVVLALSHLHTYHVVYRDLKPENILMDDEGFIAITDFGLSSDHYDAMGEGLKTFCGTPEYIAPELIRRMPYGKAVDYWSLGIMLYEMLAGSTPFYHTNRKRNFENIVRMPLRFPSDTFSEKAKSVLRGLLRRDPSKRLGSGLTGAWEIMEHPFFESVDWEKLYKRQVTVPFKPVVKKDGEMNNIPEFFKRQDVMDSAPDPPAPIGTRHEFQGFTYVDPVPM